MIGGQEVRDFAAFVNSLKERDRDFLCRRGHGQTLQQIAEVYSLTRERVRASLQNIYKRGSNQVRALASQLLTSDRNCFPDSALNELFDQPNLLSICRCFFRYNEEYTFFPFADKYVLAKLDKPAVERTLKKVAKKYIGEGCEYSEVVEDIIEELSRRGLNYFDESDLTNFLIKVGYRFYGKYISPNSSSYAYFCCKIIAEHFDFDIKLDNDGNNSDLKRLRELIANDYPELVLPDNNRALSSRLAAYLVLSNRGRYCVPEKIKCPSWLISAICQYISESKQSSFHYFEILNLFSMELRKESNITNYNFLHGVLKYYYPNTFKYERDKLTRNGTIPTSISQRLENLILSSGRPMTKEEIEPYFKGISDIYLLMQVASSKKLIQWQNKIYNHIDNLQVNEKDLEVLGNILKTETERYRGYTSSALLFKACQSILPDFLEINAINNSQNLFYTLAYYFSDKYSFKRPHVVSPEFPIQEISGENVALALLGSGETLSYSGYTNLVLRLEWPLGSCYGIFREIIKGFLRISQDKFVRFSQANISDEFLQLLKNVLQEKLAHNQYLACASVDENCGLPKGHYPWNGFLLESIVKHFGLGFKVISLQVGDIRYQRNLILSAASPLKTYDQVVAATMRADNFTSMSEASFFEYLKRKGLALAHIPQELYSCPDLKFEEESFRLSLPA